MASRDPTVGLLETVHENASPTDVRETDRIFARIRRINKNYDFEPINIWRISPLGIELVQNPSSPWSKGEKLDLEVVIEGKRTPFKGLVVDSTGEHSKVRLFGVRFLVPSEIGRPRESDERSSRRWICSEEFLPIAVAPAPGKYNSFLTLQIRNISSGGMQLFTSLDNGYLIPGMELTLSVSFPMAGSTTIHSRVVRLRIDSDGAREVLDVGVEMINLNDASKGVLGQYLVQFSTVSSVDELVKAGFIPNNITQGLVFDLLKTETDYEQVLALRKNTSTTHKSVEEFADSSDKDCRIVIGKLAGQIVCTARIGYPEIGSPLVAESSVEWHEHLPRRDQVIEVSAIATSNDAEEDILLALLRYTCINCTSEQRPHVVLILPREIPKSIARAGWRAISGARPGSPKVLIANFKTVIQGRRINPIIWNFVWRDAADFLAKSDALVPRGIDRIMLSIYRMFGPLSKCVFQWRLLRRSIKRRTAKRP